MSSNADGSEIYQNTFSVLYVHHCGTFGGSSRSLYETICTLKPAGLQPFIICPYGSSYEFLRGLTDQIIPTRGISVFDHSKYSHYRGLRWLVLIRELLLAPSTIYAFLLARYRFRSVTFSAVHINEYSCVLAIMLSKLLFNSPVILHCRAVQESRKGYLRRLMYKTILERFVSRVVAIDGACHRSLPELSHAVVIHNILNLPRVAHPALLPRKHGMLCIGFIGNLIKVKGILDLLSAMNILQNESEPVRLVVFSPLPTKLSWVSHFRQILGLRQDVGVDCIDYIRKKNLLNVELRGFQTDIATMTEEMDVICFPSHYDAPGRPVFEAGIFGVPGIVACTHPTPDVLQPGKTCLCISPGAPEEIAAAAKLLLHNPRLLQSLGHHARRLASMSGNTTEHRIAMMRAYGIG